VILKRGLDGVTMRNIAAEVGKSTGLVNHYFEDINKAVDDTEKGKVIKAVLRP